MKLINNKKVKKSLRSVLVLILVMTMASTGLVAAPVQADAPQPVDCTFRFEASAAPYLGSRRDVVIWADLSQPGALYDVGTFSSVRLIHSDGVSAVNALDISGDMRSVNFVLDGETSPAGTWRIEGVDQEGNPLNGSVVLEDAASVLSFSLTDFTKTDPADPGDRRFTFDFTLFNKGSQLIHPTNIIEITLDTRPQLIPNQWLYRLPAGKTLPANSKLDISCNVELVTPPVGYEGHGFVEGTPKLYFNGALIAPPASKPTQYLMPVAGSDGYLPAGAVPAKAFPATLNSLLSYDQISPGSPGMLAPSPGVISRYAADRFAGSLVYDKVNMKGVDLTFLSSFPGTESLSLRGCSLNNSDIAKLPALPHMTSLDIGKNDLTGLSTLKGRTGLVSLTADNNKISSLASLADLTNLKKLIVRHNNISEIPLSSGVLKNMQALSFGDNPVTDLDFLDHMDLDDPALLLEGRNLTLSGNKALNKDQSLQANAETLLPDQIPFVLTPKNGGSVKGGKINWPAVVDTGDVRSYGFKYWSGKKFDPASTKKGIFVDGMVNVKAEPSEYGTSSDTGDSSLITPWIVMMLLSLLGIFAAIRFRTKKGYAANN